VLLLVFTTSILYHIYFDFAIPFIKKF